MQSKQFQDLKVNDYFRTMKDTNAEPNYIENFGMCSNYPKEEPWEEAREDLIDQYLYENNFYQEQYPDTQRPDFDLESEHSTKYIHQGNEVEQQYDRMGAIDNYRRRVKKIHGFNDSVEEGVPTPGKGIEYSDCELYNECIDKMLMI